MGLCGLFLFHFNVTRAWSLMIIGWIFESEIFDVIELLVRNKSMWEYEWWTGEKIL